MSLILLVLGVGLGLSSVSPWSQSGISAKALGFSTIVWITVTQLLASGMGGYLAGRLRAVWRVDTPGLVQRSVALVGHHAGGRLSPRMALFAAA